MSSASKVGELFRAAGEVFSQLGDSTAQLQLFLDRASTSSSLKSKKRTAATSPDTPGPSKKKRMNEMSPVTSSATSNVQKTISTSSHVTLSALNARDQTDLDVDIEGLADQHSRMKEKFEY
jgi:hypothetical protein